MNNNAEKNTPLTSSLPLWMSILMDWCLCFSPRLSLFSVQSGCSCAPIYSKSRSSCVSLRCVEVRDSCFLGSVCDEKGVN